MSYLIAAAAMLSAAGCGNQVPENSDVVNSAAETTVPAESLSEEEFETKITTIAVQEPEPQEDKTVSEPVKEKKITPKSVVYTEFSRKYDAETGKLSDKARVASDREGFHGEGYVTDIGEEKDWSLSFDLEDEQYYNITVTAAADKAVINTITVNGAKLSSFTCGTKEGSFESVTFKNIRLPAGENKITVAPVDGGLDLDMIEITASDEIMMLDLTLEQPELSDPAAGPYARALYEYLCLTFGRSILVGQHDTAGTSHESGLNTVAAGRAPAMRCGDLTAATTDAEALEKEVSKGLEWAESGGVVSYMWNWPAPGGDGSPETVYSDGTDFDLKKAVTKESVGLLTPDDLKKLNKEGTVSDECLAVISDIDKAAEALKAFDEKGVPVIWRPVQEASNGYYWWGKDQDAYKWLWTTMYQRMTNYHGLHDLIWVWSAQNAAWYVGDGYCDVLSADVYSSEGCAGAQVNSLLYLRGVSKSKPIAMSECGGYPDIQQIADQHAMWSYIARWGGSYSVDEKGQISEKYNSLDDLFLMYNNDLTVVRDELPDLKASAEAIRKQDEEKEKEAEKAEQEEEKEESKKKDSSSKKD